jgi:hypothetical protein
VVVAVAVVRLVAQAELVQAAAAQGAEIRGVQVRERLTLVAVAVAVGLFPVLATGLPVLVVLVL